MREHKKKFIKRIFTGTLIASMVFPFNSTNLIHAAEKNEQSTSSTNELCLWYDKPASEGTLTLKPGGFSTTEENNVWQQFTLPIGNGFIGANIYGEIKNEHITFNEKTLWTGGPSKSRPDYNGGNIKDKGKNGEIVKQIQELFAQGKDLEASELCNELVGDSDGYGSYQSWGDIYFDFNFKSNEAKNYIRDLNLETAIASVNFDYENVNYNRDYFISYPDNVLAIKLSANQNKKLNFDIRFPSKHNTKPVAKDNTIIVAGQVLDNQMKFNSQLKAINDGGTITANEDKLSITDANSVIIFVAASTDYKNEYPKYRTGQTDKDLNEQVSKIITSAEDLGYDKVKENHIADYQKIFSRVKLDLKQIVPSVPTDKLLANYKESKTTVGEDRALEVMLFQYGRYLMISSSREGSLPANLQGVWNDRVGSENYVPWGSDYHMNVNLQMNYWPAYSTNMAECAIPLIEYVDSLRQPGRITAEVYSGVKSDEQNTQNGFMAHTQNTPFGWTCPGWDFSWGWSPAAVPWILQNCWEYYEYTGDIEYMKNNIYPMLKEETTLYEQILIKDITTGRMVSSPTYSPEQGPRTNGNAYEQELIWQLYEDTINAAEILGVDADKVVKWKETQSKLNPVELGESGQIKEWYSETTLGSIGTTGHRHMSHLLGLFPGDLISTETPELMEAAIVSLNDRGDTSTGWGMGQRINTWARTGDGEHAYRLIQSLFNNGIYSNLWDTHPPFQIDGNFGMTSGVSEMLLQSNMGYINILPALPIAWLDGSVKGLVARGNFEVEISWKNSNATEIKVQSNNGSECIIDYDNIAVANITKEDGTYVENIKIINDNRISFDTEKDETYTFFIKTNSN